MAKVNALIFERANLHVETVLELARYLIESGGKRLRPMLTVAAALAVRPGRRQRRSILPPRLNSCTTQRCCMTMWLTRATCAEASPRPA